MIPGMDPRAMKAAMKKMGMKQEDIVASEVIIRTPDKEIIITEPQVARVEVMGQINYQISGQEQERAREIEISQEDIDTVVAQTGVSQEKAKTILREHNSDIAATILSLQSE